MARERRITAHFSNGRRYFENSLGSEYDFTQATGPYEYLLGALSGCFYSTLASFDRKTEWDDMEITVRGYKREESPTTLERTFLDITVTGAGDEEEVRRLVGKAAEECSIYATISKVSSMEISIRFR